MECSILVGILIVLLGVFICLKPNIVWKFTEQWKSYSADEPSELYIKSTKLGGMLFVLLGFAMLILPFILK